MNVMHLKTAVSHIHSILLYTETVVQSIRQTASASAPIARTLESSLNVIGATRLAQTAADLGQLLTGITQINTALEATQFVVQSPIVQNFIINPAKHYVLRGSTTTDEGTTSAARVGSSATQADLQSAAAAPQLSTQVPLRATDPSVPAIQETYGSLSNPFLFPTDDEMLLSIADNVMTPPGLDKGWENRLMQALDNIDDLINFENNFCCQYKRVCRTGC